LTIEEAIEYQKNLNKSVNLSNRLTSGKKLDKLRKIEQFLFPNLKNPIIVDLNAKVLEIKPKF
jgi:hypothetical protein